MIERRIYGPPGTGKTHKIIHEILPDCVSKYGVNGVIVLSYTRTAAAEIISRLGSKVRTFQNKSIADDMCIDLLDIACTDDDTKPKVLSGTLHAFCFHALREPEIASDKKHFDMFIEQYKYAKVLMSNSRMEKIHVLRNRMITFDQVDHGPVKTLWELWEDFKRENSFVDFTDLIEKCFDMPMAPGSPGCIIVDEAQDLTPLQIKLLRHWNQHLKELYLIGDDDQCLYSFIGADANELIRTDIADTEITTEVLSEGRRLPESIYQYSKDYIEKITSRQHKDFVSTGETGSVANIGLPVKSCAPHIVNEAKNKTVMVLAGCSYMLDDLIKVLKDHGIPFSNKYKPEDKRWNPVNGKIKKTVSCLIDTQTIYDVCMWILYIDKKYLSEELKKSKILADEIKTIRKESGLLGDGFYRDYLKVLLTDNIFTEFESINNKDIADRLTWFIDHIDKKYKKRFEYSYQVLMGKYSKLNEITIGTIHSAKGREAEVVFVCPDKSPAMEAGSVFDKGSIIREFYVAMTRASQKLYFCTPTRHGNQYGIKFIV